MVTRSTRFVFLASRRRLDLVVLESTEARMRLLLAVEQNKQYVHGTDTNKRSPSVMGKGEDACLSMGDDRSRSRPVADVLVRMLSPEDKLVPAEFGIVSESWLVGPVSEANMSSVTSVNPGSLPSNIAAILA